MTLTHPLVDRAPTMCTPRGCVRVDACACALECTRGGLVFARVYAWWSRGPPECYSITNDQRMERRQTRGPKRHLVITSWSPHDRLGVTSAVIYKRLDPHKLGDCASWSPPGDPPRPLSVFLRRTLDPYGGTRGKSHVYLPTEISDPKIVPSTPRVHLQFTTGATTGATTGKGPRSRTPSCGFGDRCVALTLDPNVVHLSPRLISRCISSCWL